MHSDDLAHAADAADALMGLLYLGAGLFIGWLVSALRYAPTKLERRALNDLLPDIAAQNSDRRLILRRLVRRFDLDRLDEDSSET